MRIVYFKGNKQRILYVTVFYAGLMSQIIRIYFVMRKCITVGTADLHQVLIGRQVCQRREWIQFYHKTGGPYHRLMELSHLNVGVRFNGIKSFLCLHRFFQRVRIYSTFVN